MSDKVLDLRQATLNTLSRHLGEMTQAIIASNNRYVRLQEDVTNGFADMRRLVADSEARLARRINEAHSEMVVEANKILTLEDQIWQFLLNQSDADPRS
jgi:hypothetical protein